MARKEFTDQEITEIQGMAAMVIFNLPPSKKIGVFTFKGKKYRAVRTWKGFQVQSGDKRRFITDGTM